MSHKDESKEEIEVRNMTESLLKTLESFRNGSFIDEVNISENEDLQEEGKEMEELLNLMSGSSTPSLMNYSPLNDKISLVSLISHSLAAFLTTLEPSTLERLTIRVASQLRHWISQLFHLKNGGFFCHEEMRNGLVNITRMTLHKRYSTFKELGFEALVSKPPLIYLTSSTYLEIVKYVCSQLCLPESTIKLLPEASTAEMESMITKDKASGKNPILCIANVHSSIFQAQNIINFIDMCQANDIWLHMEGHALSALILTKNTQLPLGDSFVVSLGSWIGVPSVPFLTFYKDETKSSISTLVGITANNSSVRLNNLPLWCILKCLGVKELKRRIQNVYKMLESFYEQLSLLKCIRVLSQREKSFVSIDDLTNENFEISNVYRTISPALAFQYVSNDPISPQSRNSIYFDNLNSWLCQILQRDCSQIGIDIVNVENKGYVLRLCPFENLWNSNLSCEDHQIFIEHITNQCAILNSTVSQRDKFMDLISKEECLEHVLLSHWAGLGGVRYIPKIYLTKISNLTEEDKNSLNHRNIELVTMLRNLDSAFSLGETEQGHICIRFGMISVEADVEELLKLVLKTASELDDKLEELANMTELVRKGIEQAQEELRHESEELLWQEGILRHVPLVGSFYNWLSPAQKSNIKGRTLRLQEGKLESSDVLLRCDENDSSKAQKNESNL